MQRNAANPFHGYCYLIGEARNGFREIVTKAQFVAGFMGPLQFWLWRGWHLFCV